MHRLYESEVKFVIESRNVSFTYSNAINGAGVKKFDLSIPDWQVVLLCGESGCGKI